MWFITIFTECVSGTKAGDAEAHYCNEIHNTHSTVTVSTHVPIVASCNYEGNTEKLKNVEK